MRLFGLVLLLIIHFLCCGLCIYCAFGCMLVVVQWIVCLCCSLSVMLWALHCCPVGCTFMLQFVCRAADCMTVGCRLNICCSVGCTFVRVQL